MTKFKKGDKVRILDGNNHKFTEQLIGEIGEVVSELSEKYPDVIGVAIEDDNNTDLWWFEENLLEHLEGTKTTQQTKSNDGMIYNEYTNRHVWF